MPSFKQTDTPKEVRVKPSQRNKDRRRTASDCQAAPLKRWQGEDVIFRLPPDSTPALTQPWPPSRRRVLGVNWDAAGTELRVRGVCTFTEPHLPQPHPRVVKRTREKLISPRIPPACFWHAISPTARTRAASSHTRQEKKREERQVVCKKAGEEKREVVSKRKFRTHHPPPFFHPYPSLRSPFSWLTLLSLRKLHCSPSPKSHQPLLWPTITAAGRGALETSKWYHGSWLSARASAVPPLLMSQVW